LTQRPSHLVGNQHPDIYYANLIVSEDGSMLVQERSGETSYVIDVLAKADIICNAVQQDTDKPMMFVKPHETDRLKSRSIIIDVSCDEGMGFPFAVPTSFDSPIFTVGDGIIYYAVDHTPSYLWNAASREISRALIPYLEAVMMGPDSWMQNETIQCAIEIDEGKILNPAICRFQKRADEYPHEICS
jgi:alanine dehydrogenase